MKIKKILVIRYRRVGDSILALSVCRTLKRNFPEAEVHFVLDQNIASLYENHPDIDRLILFTHEEKHSFFRYIRKVWNIVHATHYDIIVDMRSTVQTLWFCLFSLGTKYRIGRKKSYNTLLQNYRPQIPTDVDMVKQNMALIRPLNKIRPIKEYPEFQLYVSDADKQAFRIYMEQQGIDFRRPVIVAAVATRIPGKVWDRERMKAVLKLIIKQYDAQIIFNFGGKAEEDYATCLHEEMGNDPHIFTNIRANSLKELTALVANCDFFFGNEGGPRHLSQALDVPSFAIYPPNIGKYIWLPENSGRHQGISIDDVADKDKITESMSYAEKFAFITVEEVWKPLSAMLEQYLRK